MNRLSSTHTFFVLKLMASISLSSVGPAALAAEDGASSSSDSTALQEIIVTSQHRAEPLSTVGIAIDAFSGEGLREAGAATVRDLAFYVPSLMIKLPQGENSYPEISLRGMSADNFDESSPQVVGVYVDGIYQSSPPLLGFQMFDQQRVEVLKGPQGTLYGRNTTAGAIDFISNPASFTSGGYVEGDYGNFNYTKLEGAYGGAITDVLAGRIAAKVVREFSGPQADPSGDDRGRTNTTAVRGSLLFKPNDDLDVALSAHVGLDRSDSWPYVQVAALVPKGQPNAGQLCPQFLAGDITGANANCVDFAGRHNDTGNPYNNPRSLYGDHHNTEYGFVAEVNWNLNDAVKLTSVSGYDHLNRREGDDEDAGTAVLIDTVRSNQIQQYSEELRLASRDAGPLNWIGGVYGSRDTLGGYPIFVSNFTDWFGASEADYSTLTTKTGAVFGQIEYALNSQFKVIGGLRETWVKRSFDYAEVYTPTGGASTTLFSGHNTLSQSDWSGKIGVNYTPTGDVLIYASVSRGFDAGTFNAYYLGSQAALAPTKQETVINYEIGLKDRLTPTLRMNLAVYYNNWNNIILTEIEDRAGVNAPYLTNGKGADIAGAEAELTWEPIHDLEISGGTSYTYERLRDLLEQNLFGQTVDLKGGRLANSPEVMANATVRYGRTVADGYRLTPQLDMKYESRSQRDLLNTPILQSPAHTLFNGRLALNTDSKWETALWVHNLTDKHYVAEAYQVVGAGIAGLVYNEPRTYGISATKHF